MWQWLLLTLYSVGKWYFTYNACLKFLRFVQVWGTLHLVPGGFRWVHLNITHVQRFMQTVSERSLFSNLNNINKMPRIHKIRLVSSVTSYFITRTWTRTRTLRKSGSYPKTNYMSWRFLFDKFGSADLEYDNRFLKF